MWKLSGYLRYIPVAALWDGEKYLIEKYQNVVFTRADKERLTRNVNRKWLGLGFGSSRTQKIDLLNNGSTTEFPGLSGVTEELQSIFGTGSTRKGVVKGDVFVDDQFTEAAFYESMKKRRPLIHISSHFLFRPGDDSRSFLILGNGTALSLRKIQEHLNLFQDVDLLTLSACDTAAVRADALGREIDGFAELSQRLGAGSVLATLWQVKDRSTALLMKQFYTYRETAFTNKGEALRKAQLDLLHGNIKTGSDVKTGGSTKRSGSAIDDMIIDKKYREVFEDNRNKFAHPYYWSPFVLFGNWK